MRWSVLANGRTTQGWMSFDAAVAEVVRAQEAGEYWRVTVHDGKRPRPAEEVPEGLDLVQAVLDRMLAKRQS